MCVAINFYALTRFSCLYMIMSGLSGLFCWRPQLIGMLLTSGLCQYGNFGMESVPHPLEHPHSEGTLAF